MRQVPDNNEFDGGSGIAIHAGIDEHIDAYEIVVDFLRRLLRNDFNFHPSFIISMFCDSAKDLGHYKDEKFFLPQYLQTQLTELLSPYIEMSITTLGFTLDPRERRIWSPRALELLDLLETLCPGSTASYEEEKATLQEWAQPRTIVPRTRSGIRELLSKLVPF